MSLPAKPTRPILVKPKKAAPVRAPAAAPAKPAPPQAAAPAPSTRKPRLRKPRKETAAVSPTPTPAAEVGERLSKRVMQLKGCSRREAEQFIEGGWVRVNGTVIEEPQHRVSGEEVVLDADASLLNLTAITLLLNKPVGFTDGLDELPAMGSAALRPAARTSGARKAPPPNARSLLDPPHHWEHDPSEIRILKRHFHHLEADVELETGATGLVVFTQDWRTTRKLAEDLNVMEQEYLVDVKGEIAPEALKPIAYALKDDRQGLPQVKVSVNSSTPELSRLRFAVKGSHPGLIAHLCSLASFEILAMRRIRLGRVAIADLPIGQWRYLAAWEKF